MAERLKPRRRSPDERPVTATVAPPPALIRPIGLVRNTGQKLYSRDNSKATYQTRAGCPRPAAIRSAGSLSTGRHGLHGHTEHRIRTHAFLINVRCELRLTAVRDRSYSPAMTPLDAPLASAPGAVSHHRPSHAPAGVMSPAQSRRSAPRTKAAQPSKLTGQTRPATERRVINLWDCLQAACL